MKISITVRHPSAPIHDARRPPKQIEERSFNLSPSSTACSLHLIRKSPCAVKHTKFAPTALPNMRSYSHSQSPTLQVLGILAGVTVDLQAA